MSLTERLRRASAAGLMAIALATGAAFPAEAKNPPAAATVPALPEPLTKETVRELVSRLSDEEVRRLLLDQLDRAAAAAPASARAERGMAGMVGDSAELMRARFQELDAALVAFPATVKAVGAKLTAPDGVPRLAFLVGLLAVVLAAGWIAEKIYDRALRHYRARLRHTTSITYPANAFRLGMGLLLDIVGLAVFGLAAVGAFLALWHEHDLQRSALLHALIAVLIVRITALFARFLLAKDGASERLLPFSDGPARTLRRFAVTVAALFALMTAARYVLQGAGASTATVDVFVIFMVLLFVVLVVWTVWRVRVPIADLLRGDAKPGAIVGWLADLWPVIATAYFLGIGGARIYDILSGTQGFAGQGLLSILLVVALPIVDMAFCRALAAAAMPAAPTASTPTADEAGTPTSTGSDAAAPAGAPTPNFFASYEAVFRRGIHIVVTVTGLLLFARLWDIDVFEFAQKSLGGKISSSLLGICIVLLLAFMIWEAAKTAIDRRLEAEGDQGPDVPASRVRTLLPLLRALILVTIVAMAMMSVLAALGVDILPLLAGASVVGVAIGFGSQTLVRDIVSGAFFLMDDAFRLGEYIEVGSDKGRVEKINVRSLFLRHHRGAINILPYGEIKRLRNTSRDWVVMVLEFRLTYDTSLLQVKKILKQIGDEIAADPELAPNLLQPLKFGGVTATEDSAIVVRAKFMARPDREPWMIQKAAYTKIIKAFREAGIKFAHKEVTVNVPDSFEGDRAKLAAEGAAALAARDSTAPR